MRVIRLALTMALGLGCGGGSASPGQSDSGNRIDGGVGMTCDGAQEFSGEATYYDADGSGNCGFPASPQDLMVGAMNQSDYAGAAACGSCVRITGPAGSVDARIVDRCPECAPGDIDLSPQAFEQIAPIADGRVPINWQYIECPVSGSVSYHFKDGSSQFWTAVQVRDHRHAIASFEYQNADGVYVDVPRENYNYFVETAGMGEGPFSFRVTDVLGNVIEDSGIPLGDDALAAGSSQFDTCE